MSIIPEHSTTTITPAVLTVAHPLWCEISECRATPDWGQYGVGFVCHVRVVLQDAELRVEVEQGETVSAQGEVLEREPSTVLIEGTAHELTVAQARQLADALLRASAVVEPDGGDR